MSECKCESVSVSEGGCEQLTHFDRNKDGLMSVSKCE